MNVCFFDYSCMLINTRRTKHISVLQNYKNRRSISRYDGAYKSTRREINVIRGCYKFIWNKNAARAMN